MGTEDIIRWARDHRRIARAALATASALVLAVLAGLVRFTEGSGGTPSSPPKACLHSMLECSS